MFSIWQHVHWKKKQRFELLEDLYQEWVVFVIVDGLFHYEIGEEKGQARFGDIVFCPPHTRFKRKVINPLTFHFIRFSSNPEFESMLVPGKITIEDIDRFRSTITYLSTLTFYENHQWTGHLLLDILFTHQIKSSIISSVNQNAKYQDPFIQEAKKYMHDHALKGTLQINKVAAKFGLSPVQFTRRFHHVFGMTPSEYITMLRLQKAKQLLLATNDTIDHIADQCGYSSGFYLTRKFKQKWNMPPSLYRKTNKL
ncbi:AraC family transcriptional regulator [Bacillus sp. SD088]|uniref:AraC family transcriptional regulator n=1 Tax=Bacillus sp. SD088 TaxID=2782012 RepID=UPI001A969358|nr:AraC family transcriptional regulator [Bacillus sp. SD088]MBO0995722.1 helix-turn-helix transcriptional regulator [Bacillus sp. SD088]